MSDFHSWRKEFVAHLLLRSEVKITDMHKLIIFSCIYDNTKCLVFNVLKLFLRGIMGTLHSPLG